VYTRRVEECKRRKGSLPDRFIALGDPPAHSLNNYVAVEAMWKEMDDTPLSEEVKNLVLEELLDSE
jgi:hypothetical protein